jgi:hypothetical protein
MSDSDKLKPENPPTAPATEAENESIIDLVEEIEEPASADSLPPLEQELLGIGEAIPVAEPPAMGLSDLGELDFDEEEDQPAEESLSLEPVVEEGDVPSNENMDWLLEPEADLRSDEHDDRQGASTGELTEKTELYIDEQFSETKEILQAMTTPSIEAGPTSEDEELELIEIEDDEADNEIVWFDDLKSDKLPPSAEMVSEAAAPPAPLSDTDSNLFSETSAADVFEANVASGLTTTDHPTAVPAPPEPVIPSIAPLAALLPTPPVQPPPSEAPPSAESLSLSAEQIDAAVERVIERRLGGSLESIVLRAVETAVANEIQRLKALLLEDDLDDRTP